MDRKYSPSVGEGKVHSCMAFGFGMVIGHRKCISKGFNGGRTGKNGGRKNGGRVTANRGGPVDRRVGSRIDSNQYARSTDNSAGLRVRESLAG